MIIYHYIITSFRGNVQISISYRNLFIVQSDHSTTKGASFQSTLCTCNTILNVVHKLRIVQNFYAIVQAFERAILHSDICT